MGLMTEAYMRGSTTSVGGGFAIANGGWLLIYCCASDNPFLWLPNVENPRRYRVRQNLVWDSGTPRLIHFHPNTNVQRWAGKCGNNRRPLILFFSLTLKLRGDWGNRLIRRSMTRLSSIVLECVGCTPGPADHCKTIVNPLVHSGKNVFTFRMCEAEWAVG